MVASYDLCDVEETTKLLKSCIVAHQGGVPQDKLDDEFFKCTGMYIPYLSIGYNSLYEYLGTVKDIEKKRDDQGQLVYTVVDKKVAHIVNMVEKQKNPYAGLRCTKTSAWLDKKMDTDVIPKRKAARQLNRGRKGHKRQKQEGKNRLRQWNQICDRASTSEGGDSGEISDLDHWFEEEYNHPVKIIEKSQKLDIVREPIVGGKQLIGDDFFLQLAIRNIGTPIWRNGPCTALNSGLCKSGLTIKECIRTLQKVQGLSNKLVIMLGAEDIYRGHSSKKMIEQMEELLDVLAVNHAFSRTAITLCTVPPLANLSVYSHREQLDNQHRFNNWIKSQTNVAYYDYLASNYRYNLIDFNTQNTTVRGSPDYEFFQLDARMVSGSSHPYVLWSHRGRRLAMNLLRVGS